MSGTLIGQDGQVAWRDMVPPVGRPTRFRALLIVGGLLALMKVDFTSASTPKWLGESNSRTHAKMRESHHVHYRVESTTGNCSQRRWMGFGETLAYLSEISAKSSPFDPQGATMRCVLPGGPGKINQGGFGLAARKAAQSFRDEDSLFIVFEEFRESFPTFGLTDVVARTSSLFLDGQVASRQWHTPSIPPNSMRACMCPRQRSCCLHAAPLHETKASSPVVSCNMLINTVTSWQSLVNIAMQTMRTAIVATQHYAVWLAVAIQLCPFRASRPNRPIQACSMLI